MPTTVLGCIEYCIHGLSEGQDHVENPSLSGPDRRGRAVTAEAWRRSSSVRDDTATLVFGGGGFVTPVLHAGGMGFDQSSGRAAVDRRSCRVRVALPPVRVEGASPSVLKELMRSASEAESRVAAYRSRVAAEYSRRMGRHNAEKTLREVTGKSTRGARTEIETANGLRDLPDTRRAFENGEITPDHAKTIVKTSERVEIDEQELVDKARKQPVDTFARTARQHERQRTEDDGASRLETQKRMRRAWIRTDRDDGMTVLYGRFDPITGAWIKNALSTRTDQLWRAEHRNTRPSTEQRMADALADLICRPDPGAEPSTANGKGRWGGATLFIKADYDTIARQLGYPTLADGTPLPLEELKRLACDAGVVPAFFDGKGQPLWVGRQRRLATRAQRRALYARDQGCVGCGLDPDWCQAHHITYWENGGPTDIDNLTLLCSRCHHQIHDNGYQIKQTPTGKHIMVPPTTRNRPPPPVKTPPRATPKSTTVLRR